MASSPLCAGGKGKRNISAWTSQGIFPHGCFSCIHQHGPHGDNSPCHSTCKNTQIWPLVEIRTGQGQPHARQSTVEDLPTTSCICLCPTGAGCTSNRLHTSRSNSTPLKPLATVKLYSFHFVHLSFLSPSCPVLCSLASSGCACL